MHRHLIRRALFGVLILAAVATALVHQAAHVTYDLSTWRVDLDDAAVGLGTVLLGVAAIWTVALKQSSTERQVARLRSQMNGGMAELARQHLQESEVVTTLVHRMDRYEAERDECIEERKRLHEQLLDYLGGSENE